MLQLPVPEMALGTQALSPSWLGQLTSLPPAAHLLVKNGEVAMYLCLTITGSKLNGGGVFLTGLALLSMDVSLYLIRS